MDGPASEADQDERHRQRPRQRAAALIAYVDTSAFVKLFILEAGSRDAVAAWDAADARVSTYVLYAEARSALASAVRAQRVDSRKLTSVRALLESLWTAIDPVEIDEELVVRAGDLAEAHALRGYDAVHLASAERIADGETFVVSADRDLLAAAQARGLATVSLAA